MAKFEKRISAHKLRRKGMSIKSIAEELDVAKSTVSLWCRDISLSPKQKSVLLRSQIKAGHKGRIIGAEVNRQKKEQNVAYQKSLAQKQIGTLSKRDKLMLGIGLYWGEGTKLGSGGVSLVNSDPDLVLSMKYWFESLGVQSSDFRPYIFISEVHKNRSIQIIDFWSKYLGIPKNQFHDVIFLKGRPKKVYENNNSYYGILALRVRKSTSLKYKVLGLIESCSKQCRGNHSLPRLRS